MVIIIGIGGFFGIGAMGGNDEYINISLNFAYILLGFSILVLLISFSTSIFRNPKEILKTIIVIFLMVVVFFVSYWHSSSEVLPVYGDISPIVSRLSEALIITTYFFLGGALLILLFSGIIRFIR